MRNIGIVGAGIAGLQLGLFLQRHGFDVTIYTDKSPDQIRDARLENLVVRFDHTLVRERALGVNHWEHRDCGVFGVHMHLGLPSPIVWTGSFQRPASGVDMRIYQATLLEDFIDRGGSVVIVALQVSEVVKLSNQHDMMVVASGGDNLSELFSRDPSRSPYTKPQRLLLGGLFRGIDLPDPSGVTYTISPGNGEIFQAPCMTFEGRVSSILIEAIPGQAFESVTRLRYEDDPRKFEATVLELLRLHAPPIYERVNCNEFAVTRPLDVLQAAITPTVRYGFTQLSNGKFAIALGDMHMQMDPIIGQGANTASKCAWILGHALFEDRALGETFCRETKQKMWIAGRAAIEWTKIALQSAQPHVIELHAAAAQNRTIADELAENFNVPENNWKIFSSPPAAAKFLAKHNCAANACTRPLTTPILSDAGNAGSLTTVLDLA